MIKSTDARSNELLLDKLDVFLGELKYALQEAPNLTEEEVGYLETYMGEASTALTLILPHLRPDMRILEIGSGIGLFGIFLATNGFDIQGVDPAGDGFDVVPKLATLARDLMDKDRRFTCHDKSCEDLAPELDGRFDLIFSVHVLEHLPDLEAAFSAMTNVLKAEGKMVHLCPNYRCPYEPHFSIPIWFWSSRLTRFFHKNRIQPRQDLWRSINFVTAGNIHKSAEANDLSLIFENGVMANFLERLTADPVFKSRHRGFIGKLALKIAQSPLLGWLRHAPPRWSTPMSIVLENQHSHKP